MNYTFRYILSVALTFLLSFWSTRGIMNEVIHHLYNRSSIKKLKLKQSIIEWFFFSRYKERVPKRMYIIYYSIFIQFAFTLFCIIVLCQLNLIKTAQIITCFYLIGAFWPLIYFSIKTSGNGFSKHTDIDAFVHKKHGNKKNKK